MWNSLKENIEAKTINENDQLQALVKENIQLKEQLNQAAKIVQQVSLEDRKLNLMEMDYVARLYSLLINNSKELSGEEKLLKEHCILTLADSVHLDLRDKTEIADSIEK